ncbi:MAG: hypothetical protein IPL58_05825 [Betaproteobacteria bacterium]|uniref:Uncharacterized protein n=1 Tax=Candidatus Proximibacter danicus TaxID=2954365 RepID=A0A9D7K2W9_9PROT|nr:hypothetical protein [Candidatus Proximibacter danicus]MBK9446644.1 hypothetical protein [Betaproteobacteria bacterium]
MTEPSTALSICRNRTQILRLLWLILFAVYALFAYQLWDGYHDELDTRLINFDELSSLRVLDAEGRRLYASNTKTAWQTTIGDRAFFRERRDNAKAGLVVSEVFASDDRTSTYLILAR